MKRKLLSWLIIGRGAIAGASILNSLDWGPSPWIVMAQDSPKSEVARPRNEVKTEQEFGADSPDPGNPNPRQVGGLPATPGVRVNVPSVAPTTHYRQRARTIARQVMENGKTRTVYETVYEMVPDSNAGKRDELNTAIRAVIESYRTTADVESRQEIEHRLTQSLSELFDLQQAEREEQLKPMEERVKKLRDTLNKRAALRDDLIQLRLKVLLQDAEGLGWGTDDEFLPRTMSFDASRETVAPTYDTNLPTSVDDDDSYTAPRRTRPPMKSPPKANIKEKKQPFTGGEP